ncbi:MULTISPECIES: SURF1 family protein [Auritidibacter]|uniref:SURF1-like protein n=1 Tax=Auritidibacter ignavus TaxID=678932 RepID=A0AAJ6DC11_9MICC|nr:MULTISPECIES: SURF1 family cytochrome oxidase biogenesis protein [Auritidibacter]PXA78130.1 hypothetical protein DCC24_00025 [Auritidibacter sp. NML100628]WGH83858.1 SURF1 family cytochrome oxidase biogenesis protein [Auritidibacter ignavus]WGH90807.1 SURF1 family cytochrome oxidase biogenesis protein [Auritidibacter ignavus]WGH93180.1 SURF1 family cytochrome oxidase biogenesis protein [Auritidibacter ignavus]WHS28469.1 SURF1 family cytochrome oxidase biogenesis protein [Auritidibacter igna
MLRTALKPRWLGFLAVAILVSAVFMALSVWQARQAVSNPAPPPEQTENPVEMTEFFEPFTAMVSTQADQMVYFTGTVEPEHTVQVAHRVHDGQTGYWIVSRATVTGTDRNVSIPVVWGWREEPLDFEATEQNPTDLSVAERLFTEASGIEPSQTVTMTGRLLPADGPDTGSDLSTTPVTVSTLATAELTNIWDEPLYAGYVVVEEFEDTEGTVHTVQAPGSSSTSDGLKAVRVSAPEQETDVVWLNVFYAIEWVIFAAFALYLWWRFVRDDYLKDQREAELDRLWEQHWRRKELEKRREQARAEKAAAVVAYRNYYGHDPEPPADQ